MADLRDALRKAGLINEEQLRREKSLANMRDEIPLALLRKRHSDIERKLEAMVGVDSPKRFRAQAYSLLTDNPDAELAQKLLDLAIESGLRKHPDEDGEALIANLQQVRAHLRRASTDGERITVVTKHLGR